MYPQTPASGQRRAYWSINNVWGAGPTIQGVEVIEQVDLQLAAWAKAVLGDVAVDYRAPEKLEGEPTAHFYLLDLKQAPMASRAPQATRRLAVRYLVTITASTPGEVNRMIADLAFAALDHTDFELDESPVPLDLWTAFGVPPRPALWLKVSVTRETEKARAPLVRRPLKLEGGPVTTLRGRVVGPEDMPLVGCPVTLPALGRVTQTDQNGIFSFSGCPAGPQRLQIDAKGQLLETSAESSAEPILIRWQPMED